MISGYSLCLPFADNSAQLIANLKNGERVTASPWFTSEDEAVKCGFTGNKRIARLENTDDGTLDLLSRLIENALLQAMLDEHCLTGENVRVYLTGIGPRVDVKDYKSLYDHNDVEDVALASSLTHLCVAKMSQDALSRYLARKYHLKHLPPNMNSTSNSALVAVHLSTQAIEQGGIDLALIINISKIKTQDIWFLATQSMLDTEVVQPFGVNSKGVLFAEGYSVMLLESHRHRQARNQRGGIGLRSAYMQINASRSNDIAWQSTRMLKLITTLLQDTGVKKEALCAVIPHGNGSAVSDGIEANAIALLAGDQTLPVLAYKGQLGYTATGSGLVDLVIGHHALAQRELIVPVANDRISAQMARHVLVGKGVIKHDKKHLLKMGVGVDGSVIAMILTDTSKEQ